MLTLLEVAVGLQYNEMPERELLVLRADGGITRIACEPELAHRIMAIFLSPPEGPFTPPCPHRYVLVRKTDRDAYEECQLCGAPKIEIRFG